MVSRRFGPVSIMISLGYYAASSFLSFHLHLCLSCVMSVMFMQLCISLFFVMFWWSTSCSFSVHTISACSPFLSFLPSLSFSFYFLYFVHTIFSWSLDKSFILSVLFICCILYSKLRVGIEYCLPRLDTPLLTFYLPETSSQYTVCTYKFHGIR